jgi:hypothetical protein
MPKHFLADPALAARLLDIEDEDLLSGEAESIDVVRVTGGERLADAVIVTTGPTAYRRADGIAVIPAALLWP